MPKWMLFGYKDAPNSGTLPECIEILVTEALLCSGTTWVLLAWSLRGSGGLGVFGFGV